MFVGFIGGIVGVGVMMCIVVNICSGGKYNILGMVYVLVFLVIVLGFSLLVV